MKVGELNLNSQWQEPGENTFMREPLTWEAFGQASRRAAGNVWGGVGGDGRLDACLLACYECRWQQAAPLLPAPLACWSLCALPTKRPAPALPRRWVLSPWYLSTCTCA